MALAVVASQFEAELIAGLLQSNGLDAAVSADDVRRPGATAAAAGGPRARSPLPWRPRPGRSSLTARPNSSAMGRRPAMSADEQFHVDAVSAAYWRVTFDNGPVNLLDPDTVEQLGALIERIEKDPTSRSWCSAARSPATSWPIGISSPTPPACWGCRPARPVCTPTWTTSCGSASSRWPRSRRSAAGPGARAASSCWPPTSASPPRTRSSASSRSVSAPYRAADRWLASDGSSDAAVPWRSSSAATTSRPRWPPSTAT